MSLVDLASPRDATGFLIGSPNEYQKTLDTAGGYARWPRAITPIVFTYTIYSSLRASFHRLYFITIERLPRASSCFYIFTPLSECMLRPIFLASAFSYIFILPERAQHKSRNSPRLLPSRHHASLPISLKKAQNIIFMLQVPPLYLRKRRNLGLSYLKNTISF